MPASQYIRLLRQRLEKPTIVKDEEERLDRMILGVQIEKTNTALLESNRSSFDIPKENYTRLMTKEMILSIREMENQVNQKMQRDDSVSSIDIGKRSSLLEILQKLRKIDPNALVLNFLESDDPNLDAHSSDLSENLEGYSDEISYHYDNKR